MAKSSCTKCGEAIHPLDAKRIGCDPYCDKCYKDLPDYLKLAHAFKIAKDTEVKETEIYHVKNNHGYYECSYNGYFYKRTSKNGDNEFCYHCGTKLVKS